MYSNNDKVMLNNGETAIVTNDSGKERGIYQVETIKTGIEYTIVDNEIFNEITGLV